MLGTLAIMGIISITTIVGFGALMNKHHANTLIEEAQKRATVIAGQIGFEKTPSLVEFNKYNTTSAGEFGKEVTTSDSVLQFGIPVSGVKKGVCQSIIGAIGDKTALRRLSPMNNFQTALTECEDDNSFLMVYNNDLGTNDKLEPPTPCYEDIDCKTECATCQIPEGDFKGICAGECDALCQEGDTCGDNECVVCDP
ncbi:MAG: hypothetical protein J6T55_01805, partial [Alphaproteobacteria bacterium]|nr:hypothetical protein [Alphaproteobacteria bacterium]